MSITTSCFLAHTQAKMLTNRLVMAGVLRVSCLHNNTGERGTGSIGLAGAELQGVHLESHPHSGYLEGAVAKYNQPSDPCCLHDFEVPLVC
jgi:hypothetical protein